MHFKHYASYLGDLVTCMGNWENLSVFRRLLDNPGVLAKMLLENTNVALAYNLTKIWFIQFAWECNCFVLYGVANKLSYLVVNLLLFAPPAGLKQFWWVSLFGISTTKRATGPKHLFSERLLFEANKSTEINPVTSSPP